MEAEQITEVINKLAGKVSPQADSSIDDKVYDNMITYIEVFWDMFETIESVAEKHSKSPFGSCKKVGGLCLAHLSSLKERLGESVSVGIRSRADVESKIEDLKGEISEYNAKIVDKETDELEKSFCKDSVREIRETIDALNWVIFKRIGV